MVQINFGIDSIDRNNGKLYHKTIWKTALSVKTQLWSVILTELMLDIGVGFSKMLNCPNQ